ncbi:putative nucleic acid-binding protein [Lupinus albus]|uniref:Putative nucleic acid-binding protein n=1 Tax=Lupinus albus TaxID=3870 RepID=A0A6A4PD51_LUPAL|nr:putative nucleic acid-binding protein [Lupinus albus]KAE9585005.1 putative nucleic acid-binding protein [Lupinus albus]KAE9585844.1 putative nucleic acid-binding protein [Lupinus albus]KAE9598429.1 putative nucleic acid-binding protein [Lupinus albus]KAE9603725.1 putative nucleic acid-binding protein [Lupinus albus]
MCDVCIFSYISIMSTSRPFDMIMDLNDSKYLWKIAVRITDIWYVQLPPKPGHLEMILMDSKGDRIQVSVRKDQFNEWREHLVESSTYVMHNFNVMHNDIQFKACDHVYRMQFTAGTTLKQREFPDIPEWEYDFKKFGDILDGNGRNDLLIDIIGAFDKVIFSQTQGNLKKVVFSLKDFSGDFINCTLWESHATKFEKHYNNHCNVEPMIILLTHARIKEGQGDDNFVHSNVGPLF